jgi:hypothetical protein
MKPMLPTSALGLVLALALGAPASPLSWESPGAGPQPRWIVPAGYFPHAYAWGHHAPHRRHRLDLHALLLRYGRQPSGSLPLNYGSDRFEDAYPPRQGMCGGWPGAGVVRFEPDGPALPPMGAAADEAEEKDQGDGDAGAPIIAAWNDGGVSPAEIPAVPEPGSLALMGAAMLGLTAAGALRKKKS